MEYASPTLKSASGLSLGQWLIVDTVTCVAFGALLVAAAGPLSVLAGLPETLLFYAGLILFPCAALMAAAARTLARPVVRLVLAGNVAWIAASIAVAWRYELTGVGVAFVTLQAAAVGFLVAVEWRASKTHI